MEATSTPPQTEISVMNKEMVNARGKFTSSQAAVKPSTENGSGQEKALPSTACPADLNAMETVTNSGSNTLKAQAASMAVAGQLVFSRPMRAREGRVNRCCRVLTWTPWRSGAAG